MKANLLFDNKNHSKGQLAILRKKYDLIGKVYCPCLKEQVIFNAQGFYHFKYHGGGRARSAREIIYKIRLFPLVIPVLRNASHIKDYKKVFEPKHGNNQKEVQYFTVTGVVGKRNNINVKVVLKKIGTGNILFWSVMRIKNNK